MKQNLFILLCTTVFIYSCNTAPKQLPEEETKAENDSIEIVIKPYKNTVDLTEYEIPIIKGTKIKHGEQKRFYRHGSLYSSIPYTMGKREGVAFTYYPAAEGIKSVVWKEQHYVENMLEGTCKRYHNSGKLQAEYDYKEGLPAIGLKEFSKTGKPLKQPTLILQRTRVHDGYYVTAKLSNKSIKANYYIGDLVEGKYFPKGLKGLQVKNGRGEVVVAANKKRVTITAVYSTKYRNKGLVSKTIFLQ